jgi:hypothetical protein
MGSGASSGHAAEDEFEFKDNSPADESRPSTNHEAKAAQRALIAVQMPKVTLFYSF